MIITQNIIIHKKMADFGEVSYRTVLYGMHATKPLHSLPHFSDAGTNTDPDTDTDARGYIAIPIAP